MKARECEAFALLYLGDAEAALGRLAPAAQAYEQAHRVAQDRTSPRRATPEQTPGWTAPTAS